MPPSGSLFAIAFALAAAATPLVALAVRRRQLGARDERRGLVAARPLSRLGGVAMAVAFAGAGAAACLGDRAAPGLLADPLLWLAGGLAFGVGVVDDLRPLPAPLKLAALAVAGLLVSATGLVVVRVPIAGWTLHGAGSIAATVVWIVALTSAWNFIDGLDGLAATVAAMAATAYWIIGAGDSLVQPMAPALSGAALGFLVHNRPPARIFMGDGGSFLLGFWVAVLSLHAGPLGTVSTSPLLMLIVGWPLADLVCAVVLRCRRRALFRASGDHLHYLLLRQLDHRRAVLVAVAVAGGCAVIAASGCAAPTAWATAAAMLALWLVCARARVGGLVVSASIIVFWLQQALAFPTHRERMTFTSVPETASSAPHAAEARR